MKENKDTIELNKKLIDLTLIPEEYGDKVKASIIKSFKVQEDLKDKEYFSFLEEKYSLRAISSWFEPIKNTCLDIEPIFEESGK